MLVLLPFLEMVTDKLYIVLVVTFLFEGPFSIIQIHDKGKNEHEHLKTSFRPDS